MSKFSPQKKNKIATSISNIFLVFSFFFITNYKKKLLLLKNITDITYRFCVVHELL